MNEPDLRVFLRLALLILLFSAALTWLQRRWLGRGRHCRLPLRMSGAGLAVAAVSWWWALALAQSIAYAFAADSDRLVPLWGMAVSHTLLAVCLPALLFRWEKIPPWQLGLHCRRWPRHLQFGLLQLMIWAPPTILANVVVRSLIEQQTPHTVQLLLGEAHTASEWTLIVYCVVLLAPFAEELLFRGILLGWLDRRLPAPLALAITAVLFAFAHSATWPDPLPLMLLGLGLGITYRKTGSLWAPTVFHAGFNGGMLAWGVFFAPHA